MWKKLLELLKANKVDEALEAAKLFQPDDFELAVEFSTAYMEVYEAQTTRKMFARIADTIGGSKSGMDRSAWRIVADNLNPTSGNTRVARSYNR